MCYIKLTLKYLSKNPKFVTPVTRVLTKQVGFEIMNQDMKEVQKNDTKVFCFKRKIKLKTFLFWHKKILFRRDKKKEKKSKMTNEKNQQIIYSLFTTFIFFIIVSLKIMIIKKHYPEYNFNLLLFFAHYH